MGKAAVRNGVAMVILISILGGAVAHGEQREVLAGGYRVVADVPGEVSTQDMRQFQNIVTQWTRAPWWDLDPAGSQLWWEQAQPGDRLQILLPVEESGQYQVDVILTRSYNYAIVQFHLNDARAGEPIDLFNPTVARTEPINLGVYQLDAGDQTLGVEIVGANPMARPGHMFGLDEVILRPRPAPAPAGPVSVPQSPDPTPKRLPRVDTELSEPPAIPIALDAYRMWERWPYQRIGVRAYMRSTADRHGGNRTADASHFLYQEAEDFNVTLDVDGPGVLYFARYNHWHGSPWHYEVDGTSHMVWETSTHTPNAPVEDSVFEPAHLFPNPLTWTWSITKGADLNWVPIPFEHRFRMAYSRTFYGTGYYIYHQFVRGIPLSKEIRAWDGRTPPDEAVLDLLRRAGTDIAPKPDTPEGDRLGIKETGGQVSVRAGEAVTVARLTEAPAIIRALQLSAPQEHALQFGRGTIRITWDDREHPSIEAPVALFFGSGTLYNNDGREYLVKALPMNIRYAGDRVHLACYFPMPFFRSAQVELIGPEGAEISDIQWSIRTQPFGGPANHVGYFHATYTDHHSPRRGHDLVFLDTDDVQGGGPWSGHLVGTSFIFTHNAVLHTLEGDPRFFFDDSQTPQAQGTGTEEWGGGGDYWGGQTMTLPLAGHPVGGWPPDQIRSDKDRIHSAYRFLLADVMPFGRRAVIRFEHGQGNDSHEHYRSVTFWYGLPAASLVLTAELDVGDPESEAAHEYDSPQASEPYELTSRYEWGPDLVRASGAPGAPLLEVFPPQTRVGRTTTGSSEFTLPILSDNHGVMLRRTLDYSFANQRAEVYVADADTAGEGEQEWRPAGVWYLAGSNTWYHSYPRDELGSSRPVIHTSNRRLRDDEFLIPRDLTRGRDAIRVRVEFTPVHRPLLPGWPDSKTAWSEITYRAYSFVMPDFHEPGSRDNAPPVDRSQEDGCTHL